MKRQHPKVAQTILIIILVLCILSVSYQIIFSLTSFTPTQQVWIDYFSGGPLPQGYTIDEIAHMNDVWWVLSALNLLFYVFITLGTGIIAYYSLKDYSLTECNELKKQTAPPPKQLTQLLHKSGRVTCILVLFLIMISFLSFNTLFTGFHRIFFPQGNWQFPADSLLLQAWPIDFFIETSMKIFGLALVIGIVFIFASLYLRHDH